VIASAEAITPRIEVRLDRIHRNARTLVGRLGARGITVTGVTKVTLGSPEVARTLVEAGVSAIGESRVEGLERLRAAGITAPLVLIRSPVPSQVDRVVAAADVSVNTEPDVLSALAEAARRQGRVHGVVLMVELGDLREGILAADLEQTARQVLGSPHLDLRGLGTNLACQSGVVPDAAKMAELSALAESIERALGTRLVTVSGGNSANLAWAFGADDVGRVDDLRLGESILLGTDPLDRRPIDGLHVDAFTLVAEVIEAKVKPTQPWGAVGHSAFGTPPRADDRGLANRAIVALGEQDVDPGDLTPPPGITVLGASSDHLVLETGRLSLEPGDEVRFGVGYRALLRAMTSPFVATAFHGAFTGAH
jgi:predicted amino acid racemase